jgi:hypothetical protein
MEDTPELLPNSSSEPEKPKSVTGHFKTSQPGSNQNQPF